MVIAQEYLNKLIAEELNKIYSERKHIFSDRDYITKVLCINISISESKNLFFSPKLKREILNKQLKLEGLIKKGIKTGAQIAGIYTARDVARYFLTIVSPAQVQKMHASLLSELTDITDSLENSSKQFARYSTVINAVYKLISKLNVKIKGMKANRVTNFILAVVLAKLRPFYFKIKPSLTAFEVVSGTVDGKIINFFGKIIRDMILFVLKRLPPYVDYGSLESEKGAESFANTAQVQAELPKLASEIQKEVGALEPKTEPEKEPVASKPLAPAKKDMPDWMLQEGKKKKILRYSLKYGN